jgi:hypothetical protein
MSRLEDGGGTEENLVVGSVGAGEKVSEGSMVEGNGVCNGVSTLANRSETEWVVRRR